MAPRTNFDPAILRTIVRLCVGRRRHQACGVVSDDAGNCRLSPNSPEKVVANSNLRVSLTRFWARTLVHSMQLSKSREGSVRKQSILRNPARPAERECSAGYFSARRVSASQNSSDRFYRVKLVRPWDPMAHQFVGSFVRLGKQDWLKHVPLTDLRLRPTLQDKWTAR